MTMGVVLAGAIRIELISLVLETKAQPLYQTPKERNYYITEKRICQMFFVEKEKEFQKRKSILFKKEKILFI